MRKNLLVIITAINVISLYSNSHNNIEKDRIFFEITDFTSDAYDSKYKYKIKIDYSIFGLVFLYYNSTKEKDKTLFINVEFNKQISDRIDSVREYIIKNDLLNYEVEPETALHHALPINIVLKYEKECHFISYRPFRNDAKLNGFIRLVNSLIPRRYMKYFKIYERKPRIVI